jgi:hypothetical protein
MNFFETDLSWVFSSQAVSPPSSFPRLVRSIPLSNDETGREKIEQFYSTELLTLERLIDWSIGTLNANLK